MNIEKYLNGIEKEIKSIKAEIEIDTSAWEYFKLSDYFDFEKGKGYNSAVARLNPGNNLFVASKTTENGFDCLTSLPNKHKGHCLTICTDGTSMHTYYQSEDFSTNKHIIVARPKFKEFNEDIAFFLKHVLELYKQIYNYGYSINLKRIKELKIKLPAKNSKPDWEYMENFMKQFYET